jgi:hydroxyacylglutathione hydrolase
MRVADPAVQKATGETDPVSVMAKLREMKNSM